MKDSYETNLTGRALLLVFRMLQFTSRQGSTIQACNV